MMMWELICFSMALTAISIGCLMPAGWLPPLPNDKLLHFLAFGGLTVLATRIAPAWHQQQYWLAGLVLAGWLIELAQRWVPGRAFCWRDMAANAAGIGAAAAGSALLQLAW